MNATVRWDTTYRYSEPVRQLHGELHVVPASLPGQQVEDWDLRLEPEAPLTASHDPFGNLVHRFDLLQPLDELRIALVVEVQTTGQPERADIPLLLQHLYRQPSARCPSHPRIDELASEAGAPAGNPFAYASRLMALLRERFEYELGHTDVEDNAVTLIELGRGVCQDFAHLMVAALRSRGLLARYVSGYMAEDSEVVTGEASHAWVQLYASGAWHGFDPSNNSLQDERYIVTALGRDYDDVPPLRGAFIGDADQRWESSLVVEAPSQQQQQ